MATNETSKQMFDPQFVPRHQLLLKNLSRFALVATLFGMNLTVFAQKNKTTNATHATLLTRRTTRHEVRRFGYGGTVTIIGAPRGSLIIEGWPRSEVEITADIELSADTEEDLDRLAKINGFVLDQDLNHLSILATGTHDKILMRRVAKDFSKNLLGLPWKIDYRIRVPVATDLEINTGSGPINLNGVEGAIRLTASESEMSLTLTGGTVAATIASGRVNVVIPVRSWRGGGADIKVALGELWIRLPPGFNGDIDADVLRSGHIENSYELESRESPGLTPQKMKARAGNGGAFFQFTVGDGTLYIRTLNSEP